MPVIEGPRMERYLGRVSDDPEILSLLAHLKISRRPSVDFDEVSREVLTTQDWLSNRNLGIEFGFWDEADFLGHHPDEIAQGPMLLATVRFFGLQQHAASFPGRLPVGLDFDDGRERVRQKLAAWDARRRSYRRDTWDLPDFSIVVGYVEGGFGIEAVVCYLRRPPLPADSETTSLLPPAEHMVPMIGRSLDDPQLRLVFAPLHIERDLADDEGGYIVDLRSRAGLELRFRFLKGSSIPRLSHLIFYREHEMRSVQWPGRLPGGLTFDDSPERMFEKIAVTPARVTDEDYWGVAVWTLPSYTLRVKYSTMENVVLRVEAVAAGADA